MQLSDHSLRQIDEAYLDRLGDGALRALSAKLLLDLKEARERLNQTSRNSSLPQPGSPLGETASGGRHDGRGRTPESKRCRGHDSGDRHRRPHG